MSKIHFLTSYTDHPEQDRQSPSQEDLKFPISDAVKLTCEQCFANATCGLLILDQENLHQPSLDELLYTQNDLVELCPRCAKQENTTRPAWQLLSDITFEPDDIVLFCKFCTVQAAKAITSTERGSLADICSTCRRSVSQKNRAFRHVDILANVVASSIPSEEKESEERLPFSNGAHTRPYKELTEAAKEGHVQLAQLLIERGVDINERYVCT